MIAGESAKRGGAVTLYMHIPKTGGTTLSHCIYQVEARGSRGEDQQRQMDRFYYRGIYHYPIGFYKDPSGFLPSYVKSELRTRRSLRAVVGHFSYGLHRFIDQPTVYVTMLRDPSERLFSLFSHLKHQQILTSSASFDDFLAGAVDGAWNARLETWHPESPPHSEQEIRLLSKTIADNDQTRRIAGFDGPFGTCDERHLRRASANLKEDFAVVGLTERFDESLVLMKRRLGWDQVPFYLPRLVNHRKPKVSDVRSQRIEHARATHRLDQMLYEFASELFKKQVDASGPGFAEEVADFRTANAQHQQRYLDATKEMGLR